MNTINEYDEYCSFCGAYINSDTGLCTNINCKNHFDSNKFYNSDMLEDLLYNDDLCL